MNHVILNNDNDRKLLDRILKIRNIKEHQDVFLNPKLSHYRQDPFDLSDMDKWTKLIIEAMKQQQSICIFGDYDVDGITSSYLLYHLLCKEFWYKDVKIVFPDRLKDWYGLKIYHLDEMKKQWHDLIITVDNGITSIEEATYAKKIWLKLIITDHHKPLDELPDADALINPQVSENYNFKELSGAWVAYKLASALLKKSNFSEKKQTKIMNTLLPLVSIATVADVVPLVDENRAIVQRGLSQLTRRKNILPSLATMLDFVNIRWPIKSHHIGFIIGPRINAWGRLATGYDSIKVLLFSGKKQHQALKDLDDINTERRRIQQEMYKDAQQQINSEDTILLAYGEDFHQWVVWIVAWRLTEKHNKPSIVLHINTKDNQATGSLRGPDYFDIMKMLKSIQAIWLEEHQKKILQRFGGHKQAWGITINLDDLELFKELTSHYCQAFVIPTNTEKIIKVDTILTPEERTISNLDNIQLLEPFGAANEEPIFLLEWIKILHKEIVGKRWNWHLKLSGDFSWKTIEILYRSKWAEQERYKLGESYDIIGKVKFDDYKKQYYVNWVRSLW